MALLAGRRRRHARGYGLSGLHGWLEDAVDGTRHAVLVRPADDCRDRVEVEDRRWRGHLPLECEPTPRVRRRSRSAAPTRDDVVEEDQRAEPEQEARER